MHTIIMLLIGLLLLAVFLLVGYWRHAVSPAAFGFIVLWFVVAAVNMWVGVNKAGYTVMQEIPFFLLVFSPPAVLALLAHYYLKMT